MEELSKFWADGNEVNLRLLKEKVAGYKEIQMVRIIFHIVLLILYISLGMVFCVTILKPL